MLTYPDVAFFAVATDWGCEVLPPPPANWILVPKRAVYNCEGEARLRFFGLGSEKAGKPSGCVRRDGFC